MKQVRQKKECDYCCYCSPENYWTTVDFDFLRMIEGMYRKLEEINPDLVAPKWIEDIEKYQENALENGERNRPLTP